MNPSDLWWQSLADGPVLLALFDADGRLRLANAAFRAAWALAPQDTPTRGEMAEAARAAGVGPAEASGERRSATRAGYEQAWRDGRRYWWVEQPTADGGCTCTGVDVSALRGTRVPAGQLLGPQPGLELLQSLLSDSRAWPLCVATTAPGVDPQALLARIRGEDGCARLDDGRLLLMLPSTAPAQAAALVERLGGLTLTEAQWGESATELLLRA
ncbi:hypothetical protein [Roseateles asaccharophilus]|uniref:PAS fold-4 domain-containing protein n=1 Tax=Roseateles asaccharophilus TaxID=582607 RepID=A0ABU2A9T9_9BURK|nr:hypothetical protein [Roseateles asaccharophilus]MDR7333237.1 hypothetical protein [Roseateles asaccharophilus]